MVLKNYYEFDKAFGIFDEIDNNHNNFNEYKFKTPSKINTKKHS